MDNLRQPSQSIQPRLELSADEVHLWSIDLSLREDLAAFARSGISEEEHDRAARFHFEEHQRRYVAGRFYLRQLLSRYLECSPGEIILEAADAGKPFLSGAHKGALEFNLSHSEDKALLGFTRGSVIGVDIERVRVLKDASELVRRFFSAREARLFNTLPLEAQPGAFANLWTGKEAFLKATGEGISLSLHKVEVAFLPGEDPGILFIPPELGNAEDWVLCRAAVPEGFAASVVFKAPARRITSFNVGDLKLLRRYEHAMD